jgi:hypothetical protein
MKHPSKLMTPADVARLSGGTITPAAVRKAADEGRLELAGRTLGGVRLFEREKVESFLAARILRESRVPHYRKASNRHGSIRDGQG